MSAHEEEISVQAFDDEVWIVSNRPNETNCVRVSATKIDFLVDALSRAISKFKSLRTR